MRIVTIVKGRMRCHLSSYSHGRLVSERRDDSLSPLSVNSKNFIYLFGMILTVVAVFTKNLK